MYTSVCNSKHQVSPDDAESPGPARLHEAAPAPAGGDGRPAGPAEAAAAWRGEAHWVIQKLTFRHLVWRCFFLLGTTLKWIFLL